MSDEPSPRNCAGGADAVNDQRSRPPQDALSSPIYRAVWEPAAGDDWFEAAAEATTPDVQAVMDRAIERVRAHAVAGTLWGADGRVAPSVLDELGQIGYWGLMIEPRYGGSGAAFRSFAPLLTRMAAVEPAVAALASVHSCIGAVKALQRFGSEPQRQRFLPALASGRRLSAFALTEPGAGSDVTAIRTYAERRVDNLLVYGEKLFITNLAPGRTLLLICRIDGQPAALVCELPDREDATFRLQHYGLHALRRTWNCGVRFDGFAVPVANRLDGGGLKIAYQGLNYARISLCANAAGTLRRLLADVTAWAQHRQTFGRPIGQWPLVRYRLARLAGSIVACDALTAWGSGLLDQGYRGELEGMAAKIFAGDSLREAAVELAMKTHGGRAFLHGHPWGDRLYDFLAPSIYEGEGELLRLAFFQALAKQGGTTGTAAGGEASAGRPSWPDSLLRATRQALRELRRAASEIRHLRRRFGAALAEQQGPAAEIADRILNCVVILCTCRWAARSSDEIVHLAAGLLAQQLSRCLTGKRPGDTEFRDADRLGEAVVRGRFAPIADVPPAPLQMP